MRKYLKTIEDIEALGYTDTKIYRENHKGYFKFVNGVLCLFCETSDVFYNATIDFNQVNSQLYIEVEDEPSDDYIGKLGWFWDDDEVSRVMDRLEYVEDEAFKGLDYDEWYKHFRPLTPEEVEKYTGYKVVKED